MRIRNTVLRELREKMIVIIVVHILPKKETHAIAVLTNQMHSLRLNIKVGGSSI